MLGMKLVSYFIILSALVMIPVLTGCGDDDDDSRGGSGDDDNDSYLPTDDDAGDDDAADDDTADDVTTDDDTTDDDTADDDTVDDDTTYPSLRCEFDPESIGGGNSVGGGAITDQITVYTYDHYTCQPVEGFSILHNDQTTLTDADGKAVLTSDAGAQRVTVTKDGYHRVWTYEADAQVMYFRVTPNEDGSSYADSEPAQFMLGDTPVSLENPTVDGAVDIGNLITYPVFLGGVLPGLARDLVLFYDLATFQTKATFPVELNLGSDETTDLPANLYLPAIEIDLFGYGVVGAHAEYQVPARVSWDTNPIEGGMLSVSLGEFLDADTLLGIITDLIGGALIEEIIAEYAIPLVNQAVAMDFASVNPEWNGTDVPDLEAVEVNPDNTIPFTVANPAEETDYVGLLWAEIRNRASIPLGLKIAEEGAAALPYGTVPEADYRVWAVKTNWFATGMVYGAISVLCKYTDEVSDWSEGVEFDDADFLPYFDESSDFDYLTGEMTWSLVEGQSRATVDAYLFYFSPACASTAEECPTLFAVLPGSANSYTVIADEFGMTLSPDDTYVLVGVDLPDDVDVNEFDPTKMVDYDYTAFNFYTNLDVMEMF